MSDKHDGIEQAFDRDSGISLVDLVSMGCPGNLLDLVSTLASQPDTPIPSLTDAMAAVLFSFQFPEDVLIDIIDDFAAMNDWQEGDSQTECKFPGSRKFIMYFESRHIEQALAITRARAKVGIEGWKHHHFADEYTQS